MPKRFTPYYYPSVEKAKLEKDKKGLSYLGQKGGRSRKQRRLSLWLSGSREMGQEANENICPVD